MTTVYRNRLRIGMLLQWTRQVIYAKMLNGT